MDSRVIGERHAEYVVIYSIAGPSPEQEPRDGLNKSTEHALMR